MLKKIHKVVGLSVSLIVIHLAITGIMLMYPNSFKLQDTFLSNNYILSLYDMSQTTDVRINKQYINLGIVSKKVIIDDYVIDTGLEGILSLAKYKKQVFISSDKNLLLISNEEYEPKIIKNISFPFVLKQMALNSNKEVNFIDEQSIIYYLNQDFKFVPIATPLQPLEELFLVPADKAVADLYLNYVQGPGIQLLRLITDIHNGRFFGKIIMIIFTISSLAIIFLALSGTLISLNITLKRRVSRKKKKNINRKLN